MNGNKLFQNTSMFSDGDILYKTTKDIFSSAFGT